MHRAVTSARTKTLLALLAILLAALALRLFLLAGPQTELEGDEAIVGLMGRHILRGEWPLFYYMQPYMGSLEAYLVAGVFALVGSSTFALKLVPMLGALLYVGLLFATGYRLGGLTAAVVSGVFAAVPPAFLAVWSLKARGGYIEILVIGQLLILLAMHLGKRGRVGPRGGFLLGLVSGLGLWTNPLIVVYLIPVALYLLLVLRRRVVGVWVLAALAGVLIGSAPLIGYNLTSGFATGNVMEGGEGGLDNAPDYLHKVLRLSLPILAGLVQASSSPKLFGDALAANPANRGLFAQAVSLPFFLLLLFGARRLPSLLRGREEGERGDLLLSLLMIAVPTLFIVTRFREMVSEPRYLLPLYSAVPLLGVAISLLRPSLQRVAAMAFALVIVFNLVSVARLDPRLNLPDTAVGSTESNRAELADFLLSRGLNRVYTDYWLAYTLAFESQEQVVPSVMSGGFNRYIPYAHQVKVALNPAFVFIEGSREEGSVLQRWKERGVEARRERISIYSVYWDARPLDQARP